MTEHDLPLGALVLGTLDPAERADLDTHLAGCAACRAELVELEAVRDVLDELPPEALIHQPPDADLVLQRTLRQIRSEANAGVWQRRTVGVAAAAVLLAGALGAGVAVGRGGSSSPHAQASPTPSATASRPPAGVRSATGLDPATQTRMTVQVTPAAGWVRLNASVNGIPAGENCRLVVVGKNGDQEIAAGWVVSKVGERDGTNLDGSAAIPVDEIKSIEVRNTSGKTFVSVAL